jgi:hypothetical protein
MARLRAGLQWREQRSRFVLLSLWTLRTQDTSAPGGKDGKEVSEEGQTLQVFPPRPPLRWWQGTEAKCNHTRGWAWHSDTGHHLQKKQAGPGGHPCHPITPEGKAEEVTILVQKARPYLKTNQSTKGWRCGSSGRGPALKGKGPEFKLRTRKKKKKVTSVCGHMPLKTKQNQKKTKQTKKTGIS